jgi:hypothetical protein
MQLAKQVGEYLAAAELCRRGFVAATFSGNVQHYDILASDEKGNKIAVQVKTIRGGSWQFDARNIVKINILGKKQVLGAKKKEPYPNLICIFILMDEYGRDQFFLFSWRELQNLLVRNYRAWLKKHNGIRPRNPRSFHSSINPTDLENYKDNWNILLV